MPHAKGAYSELNTKGLNALIQKSSATIVIDFWAPWCGPCKMFGPHFQTVAHKLCENIIFIKLNTEQHPDGGAQHQVRGIPTLLLIKNHKEFKRVSGAMDAANFERWLSE